MGATADNKNPIQDKMAPKIVTLRHPYLKTKLNKHYEEYIHAVYLIYFFHIFLFKKTKVSYKMLLTKFKSSTKVASSSKNLQSFLLYTLAGKI